MCNSHIKTDAASFLLEQGHNFVFRLLGQNAHIIAFRSGLNDCARRMFPFINLVILARKRPIPFIDTALLSTKMA